MPEWAKDVLACLVGQKMQMSCVVVTLGLIMSDWFVGIIVVRKKIKNCLQALGNDLYNNNNSLWNIKSNNS